MSLSNFGPGSASNEANGDDRRERAVQESPRESAPVTSAHREQIPGRRFNFRFGSKHRYFPQHGTQGAA